jgi:hypothetical protein
MQFPFENTINHQCSIPDIDHWISQAKPTQIEMSDNQYAWYANLMRANRRDHNGIPIVFLDGKHIV